MKLNELFESNRFLTDESEIEAWLKEMKIENYEIDEHGFVNADRDVNLTNRNLSKIPIRFGWVDGDFICSFNNLTSLEGAPREVGGGFFCSYNNLTSLEGAPREVSGNFYCSYNKLITLEGAPREVSGSFYCNKNRFMEKPDHSFININRTFIWK